MASPLAPEEVELVVVGTWRHVVEFLRQQLYQPVERPCWGVVVGGVGCLWVESDSNQPLALFDCCVCHISFSFSLSIATCLFLSTTLGLFLFLIVFRKLTIPIAVVIDGTILKANIRDCRFGQMERIVVRSIRVLT